MGTNLLLFHDTLVSISWFTQWQISDYFCSPKLTTDSMQTLDTSWLRPSSISLRVVVWFLLGIIQSKTPLWFIDMISSYIQGNNSSHSCVWSSLSTSSKLIKPKWNTCCVSVQGLHPSEEHSKANYVTTPREGCSNLKTPPNSPSFWRMHRYNPSWPHISRDSLHARKSRKK